MNSEMEKLDIRGLLRPDERVTLALRAVSYTHLDVYKRQRRDIELVRQTGCPYHICHVSAKESLELVRQAKAEGLPVTCETGPHYLILCEDDLQEDGRFKMNPPLRGREDKAALLAALKDGTIDAIATDHAPHSIEEKSKGLAGSAMGIEMCVRDRH